jgi:uncharacterized protein (TIGR00251 family)
MALQIDHTGNGLLFNLRVQPRASKNAVAGLYGGALKLKITAAPVKGAANNACVRFLAKSLDVPKSAVEIISGATGRDKRVCVRADKLAPEELERRLRMLAGESV